MRVFYLCLPSFFQCLITGIKTRGNICRIYEFLSWMWFNVIQCCTSKGISVWWGCSVGQTPELDHRDCKPHFPHQINTVVEWNTIYQINTDVEWNTIYQINTGVEWNTIYQINTGVERNTILYFCRPWCWHFWHDVDISAMMLTCLPWCWHFCNDVDIFAMMLTLLPWCWHFFVMMLTC